MIRPLRSAHRRIALALLLLGPAGVALGIGARPALSPQGSFRVGFQPPTGGVHIDVHRALRAGEIIEDVSDRWSGPPLELLVQRFADARAPLIQLRAVEPLAAPDVLVYWAAVGGVDALPDGARLLGRLAGAEAWAFALPSAEIGGRVYAYSLAHGELQGSASLDGAAR